jgi:hypothetical protein
MRLEAALRPFVWKGARATCPRCPPRRTPGGSGNHALLASHEVSRIGLFDHWVSRFAEPERLFGTLPPGDVSRLTRSEMAFDGILPESPKQVVDLAEIKLDRSFQKRNSSHPPRLVVLLAQLAHANEDVDEADEPLLPE